MASYQPKISDLLAKPHQARSHNVSIVANSVILIIQVKNPTPRNQMRWQLRKRPCLHQLPLMPVNRRDESRESKDSKESSADSELSVPQVSAQIWNWYHSLAPVLAAVITTSLINHWKWLSQSRSNPSCQRVHIYQIKEVELLWYDKALKRIIIIKCVTVNNLLYVVSS